MQNINVSCHQQYKQVTLPVRNYNNIHVTHYNFFLSVLFSELSDSNDHEKPGLVMRDESPVDPGPEVEPEKTNSGRLLSN